ncbi:zinc finger protein 410 [Eucyclogobius newberryi]|uniref:zinc finger protein 410 n=1 Tax=Eucyclogobius newberryi TaxID=166745 RepID=UPI003B5C3160
MLSDELDSKPELLVQFVQSASIPLVQGLEESSSKSCVPLLPPAVSSLSSALQLSDERLSHEPGSSPPLSEFGAVSEDSSLVPGLPRASPSPLPILHELQQPDASSYVLLNLAKASSESLIFGPEEDDEGLSSGGYGVDGAPWYLRVQELAHDSLIAATRAQIARDARANQEARAAATVANGDLAHGLTSDPGDRRRCVSPRPACSVPKSVLHCSFEGCCRTFIWPAHLKYHLKTHRNDRMFRCGAEGCGKSFYVLQRLQVHMRTHNGDKPFICKEKNCGKKFTTAGNLKNHRRIHTGEKPFLCEADGCGRSFAEYSSLRKHMLVHSGEKPHVCGICGKTFSQSGSRNVHMKKRHGDEGVGQESRDTGEALTHSSLLEVDGEDAAGAVSMTTAAEPMGLHHTMLRAPGSVDSVVVLSQPHHLVSMTTDGHSYGDDVVTLL